MIGRATKYIRSTTREITSETSPPTLPCFVEAVVEKGRVVMHGAKRREKRRSPCALAELGGGVDVHNREVKVPLELRERRERHNQARQAHTRQIATAAYASRAGHSSR